MLFRSGRLEKHNPIYYLAKRVWFDNDRTLLYAPLHRDVFCKHLLSYYFASPTEQAGAILLCQRESYKTTFNGQIMPQFVAFRGKTVCDLHPTNPECGCEGKDIRTCIVHHKDPHAWKLVKRLKAKHYTHKFIKDNWPEFKIPKSEWGTEQIGRAHV